MHDEEVQKNWHNIFQVLKEKNCQSEFYTQRKYSLGCHSQVKED